MIYWGENNSTTTTPINPKIQQKHKLIIKTTKTILKLKNMQKIKSTKKQK